jgi:hypothetical protein
MVDHLSIPDMLLAGAEKPFMFSVTIVIFALNLSDFLVFSVKDASPGGGWHRVLP